MKCKLPEYVVNSLLVAGFDMLEVISLMDVSNNSGNSIDEVEEYVHNEHRDWLPKGKCLPWHRLRLRVFVEEVRKSRTPVVTLGKSKKVCKYSSSKGRRVKTDAQSHESPAFMFTSTHTQIAKWKKQQSGAVGDVT